MQKEIVKEKPMEEREPLGRRELFVPLGYRLDEMNRWFEEPMREFETLFREPPYFPWATTLRPYAAPGLLPRFSEVRQPLTDIEDRGKEFVVITELPGIPKEDVDVHVMKDVLEIRAKKEIEEEREKGYYRKERAFKELYRHLVLPAFIIPDAVEAKLEDGLLTIRLPKKEPTPELKKLKVRVE
jgi:HSP20 family protein